MSGNYIKLTKCDWGTKENERFGDSRIAINKYHVSYIEEIKSSKKTHIILNNSQAMCVREDYQTVLEKLNEKHS